MKAETERSLVAACCFCPLGFITKYYGLGNLNNRNIVFYSSGGQKSKSRVLDGWVLVKTHLIATFCLGVFTWHRKRERG